MENNNNVYFFFFIKNIQFEYSDQWLKTLINLTNYIKINHKSQTDLNLSETLESKSNLNSISYFSKSSF